MKLVLILIGVLFFGGIVYSLYWIFSGEKPVKKINPITPKKFSNIKEVAESKELTFQEIVSKLRVFLNNKDYTIPDDFEVHINLVNHYSIETLESLSKTIFKYVSNLKKSIDSDLTIDMGLELDYDDGQFIKLEIINNIKDGNYIGFRGPFEISLYQITSPNFDLVKDKGFVEYLYDCSEYIITMINKNKGDI